MMYSAKKLVTMCATAAYPLLWDGFYLSVVDAEIISYITGQNVLRTQPSILAGCLTREPQPEFITVPETAADVQADRGVWVSESR